MAVLQRAWRFRPQTFHGRLQRRVAAEAFDEAALRREARAIAQSYGSHEYLRMLGWNPPPDIDETSWGELYIVCMTPELEPVQQIGSFGLLCGYLERIDGWSRAWTQRLARGDPLVTMVDEFPVDALTNMVRSDVGLEYGGWLSPDAAAELEQRLEGLASSVDPPKPAILSDMCSVVGGSQADVIASVVTSFREAQALLASVIDHEEFALRLVWP